MPNKRDTSKQKRARENRAQREALKARTEAASLAPEERRTRATSAAEAPTTKAGKASKAAERTRPIRPGDVPVDVATLEGNWFTKRTQVPGGRQVLLALALTVVSTLTLAIQKYPPDGAPAKADRTESLFDIVGAAAWPLLLVPPLIVLLAAASGLHPKRRRIWTICAAALGIVTLAALSFYLVNLFALGFLVYGIQRAAKIEGPAPGSRFSARGAAPGRGDRDAEEATAAKGADGDADA